MRTSEVLREIVDSCGPQGGDEGILFGDREQEVGGIQVCWMASLDAIEHAKEAGANLIIAHEDLYFPSWRPPHSTTPVEYLSWRVNQRRIGLLAESGIAVIRAHGMLDRHCIFTAFAERLSLGKPAVDEGPYLKAYDLPPGTTYGALVEHVKSALGMEAVRATPYDPTATVRRAGLPWGGLGLFVNVGYMQSTLKYGCDVFIAGESDNYGMHFALDSGVPMIETSHEVSENPGLAIFAQELQARLPEVPVHYYENQMPWRWW
ncbi:MAG: Nif3-like dinuclear metal center hexameric protein [Chloroflexi bacterium]|nr:Nif3-like dinuclear metal center hexameric protein [Chloroflexota bacterium]